ncbi:MAG TPA: TonB-dependent receptor plug domain-containing protein, partial [Pyrinomonadaceae bacterium]|nr:TonB-dependent receptor plug domain-containing protein [Pyrinomonadaceae bacterium]
MFFLVLLLGTVVGRSQTELGGRILDGNGASVPGALVILKGLTVRYQQEVTAGQDGNYSFSNVPTGEYELLVSNRSFAVQRERLTYPDRTSLDVTLLPQPIAADVSVNANLLAGTEASLSEVPGSIERVDSQTLQNSRVFNFSEALRKVSGVIVRDEEGFGLRPNIGIRGTNPTRSTKVLLLEDGVPLTYAPYGDNASYYHPPIERYESIEVLKGS